MYICLMEIRRSDFLVKRYKKVRIALAKKEKDKQEIDNAGKWIYSKSVI